MLYFWGFLAFFQIAFLPGFLFVSFLKIKTKTTLERTIFIFALSLIINFILVFALTLIKLYQPIIVYFIFFVEIVTFLFTIKNCRITFSLNFPKKSTKFFTLIFILSFVVIARFLVPFIQNFFLNSVFLQGDAIDSWNLWATIWAKGNIPTKTFHYPQLIPANWSLTYVFMQTTSVELFAKLVMPLFTLAILFIFFDLGNFVGLIITGILFHYYFDNSFLRDGYVDLAFAFFAFLPFYCFLLYQKYKNQQYLLLMILFALGSFLTKQLGAYILLLTLIYFWRKVKNQQFKKIKLVIAVVLATTIFWYLYKFPEIKNNYNIESVYQTAMVNKLANFSIISRIRQSLFLLTPNVKGVLVVSVVILLLLFSLKNKLSRQLIAFVILPIFIFWSTFLNYDQRNLVLIFPYLGSVYSTVALQQKVKIIKFSINPFIFLMIFFIVFLLIGVVFVPNQKLLLAQTEGKKQIGIPELNSRLYDYYYKNGFEGKIATSYYRLCNLPDIGRYCLYNPNKIPPAKYYLYRQSEKKLINKEFVIFRYQDWIFLKR